MNGMMTRTALPPDEMVEIPDSLIRIVADVIAVAWRRLLTEYKHDEFCGFVEDTITERLYMILSEIDDDPAEELRELALLQSPVREGNIRNFNNTHPDKQPDLTYRPAKGYLGKVGNTATAAIFIECKPIDQARPVGSTYCKAGLIRFVNGDYAWRVNRAMMVGYVRNISKLPGSLNHSLALPAMSTLLGCTSPLIKQKPTLKMDDVWSSTHTRSFKFNGKKIADIQVDHLWLYPDKPCENTTSRGGSSLVDSLMENNNSQVSSLDK